MKQNFKIGVSIVNTFEKNRKQKRQGSKYSCLSESAGMKNRCLLPAGVLRDNMKGSGFFVREAV